MAEEDDLAAMYSSDEDPAANGGGGGGGGGKGGKKKKTMIPCGTCGANNDAFSIFCIFCSRRLDRSAARAHKCMTQALAGTRLPQKVIAGLYYHFAFQNFRVRDVITHEDDRKTFMESLGLEDDPRMRKVFDDFDQKQDESIEFLEYARGIESLSMTSPPMEKCRFLFQTYDQEEKDRLSKQQLAEILRDHTKLTTVLKAENEERKKKDLDPFSTERTLAELESFWSQWMKKGLPSVFRNPEEVEDFKFEQMWQMLHADCKGKPMYEWLEVDLEKVIAIFHAADKKEELRELEDKQSEAVFYASGLPNDLHPR